MNITREKVESGYSYHDGVWSGGVPTYEKLSVSLGKLLLRKLYNRRNETFQIDPQTKTQQTCNEIREQAINFSLYLKQVKCVNVGDVIAFCAHNDKYSIVLVLSAIFLGLPVICIDPALSQDETDRIIQIVKPSLLVCETDSLSKFTIGNIKHIIEKNANFYMSYLSSPKTGKKFIPAAVDVTKAIMLYMYTGGFTGPPQIVPYTQNFYYTTIYRMQHIATHHDIILNVLPFCHWGAIWSLLFCLLFGSTHIALTWSSSIDILKLIQKYEVTCLNIYTKHLMYVCLNPKLENYPLVKKIRLIWSRGKSNPTEQIKFMRSILECTHIVNCYTCVEFGGFVTHFDPTYEYDMNIMKINSMGRLRRGCKAKILDIETRKSLGPNQHGELLVKTEDMPQKYYSLNTKSDITEDDWYVTGDYAKFDEEQCLYVVSPHDIEYLISRMPTVRHCGVIGIPDSILGYLPTAFVVKEPNAEVTEKEIIKTVALEGKDYQRLRGGVYFISKLPTLVVAGVSRRELKKLYLTLPPKNSCKCGLV